MATRLALLVCLLGLPALASAQSITVAESNDTDQIINNAECNNSPQDTITFQWTVSSTTIGGTFDLFISDTTGCPTPTTTTNTTAVTKTLATGITSSSNSGTYAGGQTASQLLQLVNIPCTSADTALFICVNFNPTGAVAVANAATGSIKLDLLSPAAPIANAPTPGDGALNVSWRAGAGAADAGVGGAATGYKIYCGLAGTSPLTQLCGEVTSGSQFDARITGLTNGTAYDVQVTARTQGGNESARSNTVTGTPIQINDFWRAYRQAGGVEEGGCATGAAGLAALVALVPLALRRRRRR